MVRISRRKPGILLADIFLSYARADQSRVELIAAALEQAGYSVWWDRHIEGGSQYAKDIEEQITAARAVIVIWSAASVESEWVRDEAAVARDANKLVPIMIDSTVPPIGFRQRQAIDLTKGADESVGLSNLKAVLDRLIDGEKKNIAPVHVASSKLRHAIIATVFTLIILATLAGYFGLRNQKSEKPAFAYSDSRKSVAVLPFVAQSSSEDDQYFADGVTEEILNRLDALDELRVLPRTTIFSLRDNKEKLETLTEILGVDYVVEGSLRRGREVVRVSARLIRSRDSETLWSNSYDGAGDDVLQFQSDIAEKVAGSLDVLLDEKALRRMEDAGVDDPEAFSLYAKALELHEKGHMGIHSGHYSNLYEASQLFDRAFEAAPKLWRAAVHASDVYAHIILDKAGGIDDIDLPLDVRRNAHNEMQRRLELARAAAPTRQHKLAIELYATAYSDDWSKIPSLSSEYYTNHDACEAANVEGFLITALGQVDEIADAYLRMEDCRAGEHLYAQDLSRLLARAGRAEDARAFLNRERNRGLVDEEALDNMQSTVERHSGNYDKAIALVAPRDGAFPQFLDRLLASDTTVVTDINEFLKDDPIAPSLALSLIAVSGQRERANAYAAEIDARPGGPTVLQLAVDYCSCGAPFDIENTPNYAAVLDRSGLSWPMRYATHWPLKDW